MQQQKNARLPSSPASPLRPGFELPGHDHSTVQSHAVLAVRNSTQRAAESPGGETRLRRATFGLARRWRAPHSALFLGAHQLPNEGADSVVGVETHGRLRSTSDGTRIAAFDHRGMYLKVNAPTKHTDTPLPRPARPDLYNVLITACLVVRVLRACSLIPWCHVSVSLLPSVASTDDAPIAHSHAADVRCGRHAPPPYPPALPPHRLLHAATPGLVRGPGIPHVPHTASRPHGRACARQLGRGLGVVHARASHAR